MKNKNIKIIILIFLLAFSSNIIFGFPSNCKCNAKNQDKTKINGPVNFNNHKLLLTKKCCCGTKNIKTCSINFSFKNETYTTVSFSKDLKINPQNSLSTYNYVFLYDTHPVKDIGFILYNYTLNKIPIYIKNSAFII